jgi:hypothetical protein
MQRVSPSYLVVGRIVADRWLRLCPMKAIHGQRLIPDRREETN